MYIKFILNIFSIYYSILSVFFYAILRVDVFILIQTK